MLTRPDFIIIPDIVCQSLELHPKDKTLYGYIYWLEKLRDGMCTADNETLAKLNTSEPKSIQNGLTRLEKNGFIVRKFLNPISKSGRQITCLARFSLDRPPLSPNNDTLSPNIPPNNNIYIYNNNTTTKDITNIEIKRISISKEIKDNILSLWNSLDIYKHSKFTDRMEYRLASLLKDFELSEVIQGIKNYGEIVKSPKTYFKHKWVLEEFLQRENGCRVFIFKKVEDYLKLKENAPSGLINAEEGKYDHIDSKLSW